MYVLLLICRSYVLRNQRDHNLKTLCCFTAQDEHIGDDPSPKTWSFVNFAILPQVTILYTTKHVVFWTFLKSLTNLSDLEEIYLCKLIICCWMNGFVIVLLFFWCTFKLCNNTSQNVRVRLCREKSTFSLIKVKIEKAA